MEASLTAPTAAHGGLPIPELQTSSVDTGPIRRDGFLQIRVAGGPYEMGLQHGEQLRDEIRGLLDATYHHVLNGQPGVVGWGSRGLVRTTTRFMEPFIPKRYRQEIAGVARGADVPYADILLLSCFDDVLANLRLLGEVFGRLGCSTFALLPERTDEGELICGRNLDYFVQSARGDDVWAATNYMKEHVAVIEFAPRDGAEFISVGWPGFVGTVTAMSRNQMVVGSMTIASRWNWAMATPSPFLYRHIMERASTLGEGVDILTRAKRTQANNVLIGSGTEGKAAVVEYTPWGMATRPAQDGWVAATNHFNDPCMSRSRGLSPYRNSFERFDRLSDLCTAGGLTSLDGAASFLADVQRRTSESTEDCVLLNPSTLYSTLFAPERGRLWVRTADRPARRFEEVAFV